MSRIGLKPIQIPEGVSVDVKGQDITVKGPKGELSYSVDPVIEIHVGDNEISFTRKNEDKKSRSIHGTTRSNVNNMVIGVSQGFEKKLELTGVGYRAQMQGKKLTLAVGKSHPVEFETPEDMEIECPSNTEIVVRGIDKVKVGELAANIRAQRAPEPYKGKGIHYVGEHILRKEGKTGK